MATASARSGLTAVALAALIAGGAVRAEEPLSAIPWLSDTLRAPPSAPIIAPPAPEPDTARTETPVSPAPPPGRVDVVTLGGPSPAAAGLVPAARVGLPDDLWRNSNSADLARRITTMPMHLLPALQRAFTTLMIVESPPPATGGDEVFLARVDALLARGTLDQAQALLERATPETPALFRRWFDVGLLTGTEDRACATLGARPELTPNYETQVFCFARGGRWPLAALTLETATALGQIDQVTRDRLARFLDPELFEGEPPLPRPDPVTPLDYRLLEAVGEPVPTAGLPLAFAQSDLRHIVGWKSQIEAAERLARAGALSPNVLLGIYTARRPAASGGVWDRVEKMQALDIAITAADARRVAGRLPAAEAAMHDAGLDAVFATLVAPRLLRQALQPETALAAYRLALISNTDSAFAPPPANLDLPPDLAFLSALATGALDAARPRSPLQSAVLAAFRDGTPAPEDARLLQAGETGMAILAALDRLAVDRGGDPDDVRAALAVLRRTGLEDAARHTALQLLSMDFRG